MSNSKLVKVDKGANPEQFLLFEEEEKWILNPSENFFFEKYVMFENNANICWLNCALALLVNNKTLCCSIKSDGNMVSKVVIFYRNRMTEFNKSMDKSEKIAKIKLKLKLLQDTCLSYLQPYMKCQQGIPDSAFCALSLFVSKDNEGEKLFSTNFTCYMKCENCENIVERRQTKCIVTLTEVENFVGDLPVAVNKCASCKTPNQKMFYYYHILPPCLLFHFEKGAGTGRLTIENFAVDSRKYHLTGVVMLYRSNGIDHFVTWIRDPDTNRWLEINDLSDNLSSFSEETPILALDSVYILSFEALDELGIVSKVKSDLSNVPNEISKKTKISVVDLSNESESDSPPASSNFSLKNSEKSGVGSKDHLLDIKREKNASTDSKTDGSNEGEEMSSSSRDEAVASKQKVTKNSGEKNKKANDKVRKVEMTQRERDIINIVVDEFGSRVFQYFGIKNE